MDTEEERSIETLRDDIEVTRQRISGELEAIGERLTPEHAKQIAKEKIVEAKDRAIENVKTSTRRAARITARTGGEIGHAIRDNPIPSIMVGVGAGWLLWNAFSRARRMEPQMELPLPEPEHGTTGYGEIEEPRRMERARDRVAQAKERVSHAKERMSEVAHRARHRTGEAAHAAWSRTGETAHVAWDKSNDAYANNPLLFGAVAVAAGLAVGMLVPSTERENALFGTGRDRLIGRAKDYAREVEQVTLESAREGLRAAKETAKRNVT